MVLYEATMSRLSEILRWAVNRNCLLNFYGLRVAFFVCANGNFWWDFPFAITPGGGSALGVNSRFVVLTGSRLYNRL